MKMKIHHREDVESTCKNMGRAFANAVPAYYSETGISNLFSTTFETGIVFVRYFARLQLRFFHLPFDTYDRRTEDI